MHFRFPPSRVITINCIILYAIIFFALLPSRLNVPASETFLDDAGDYHQTAVHIATQGFYSYDGVTPYVKREPGYSVFLGGIYFFFGAGNRLAIFLAQGVLYLAAALFFVSQLKHFDLREDVQGVCLFLLMVLPSVFHTIFFVYRESFTLSLFLMFTGLFLCFQRRQTWPLAITIGVLLAAIILTYISFLFLPIFLIALFFLHRFSWKYLSAIVVLPLVLVSLWGVRNFADDGQFRLIDPFRTAVMWYVRGEQAEKVTGTEPFLCLWSEYVSRNWTGRSPACSFNGLMHAKWPEGKPLGNEAAIAREGQGKILAHFPNYLWFSAFDVLEFHLPYVDGWGRIYNMLAALSSLVLYAGCALAVPAAWRKKYAVFLLLIVYTVAVFVLTDATPRYQMPIIFCYALLAAVGYIGLFRRFHPDSR